LGAAVPLFIVSVEVVVPLLGGVTDVGFRLHVGPAGATEQVRPTALLNAFIELTVTVEVVLCPGSTGCTAAACMPKSWILRLRFDEVWLTPPDVPVTVTVYVPGVTPVVVIVSDDVALPFAGTVTEGGSSVHVAETGMPLQVRFTVPAKPSRELTVTVDVTDCPGLTIAGLKGVAETLKSVTTRLTVVDFVSLPDVPVMVTV